MKKLSGVIAATLILSTAIEASEVGPSAIPSHYIPMITEDELGARTTPLLELGNPFLMTGRLTDSIILPTGAVWTPSLWVFGGFRTALANINNEAQDSRSEWSNRLDLFANLQLSGTERVVLGVSPIHKGGKFATYTFAPDNQEGWDDEVGFNLTNLFFEGELTELFPNIDPGATSAMDFGFAFGRQQIDFQDGFLVNDNIDSIGIVKNNLYPFKGVSNLRVTFIYGWNEVGRDNNKEDDNAKLYGLFTHWDLYKTSMEIDAIYVDSSEARDSGALGDSFHIGLGLSRRFGHYSVVGRVMASDGVDFDSAGSDDGVLAFGEISTSPKGSENIVYATGFWSTGNFKSASRAGTVGGPLGRVGLLFASAGLGSYKPALSNRAGEIAGGALGYQMFFDNFSKQLIVEAGVRHDRSNSNSGGFGVAAHYQHKLNHRMVWRIDAYLAHNDGAKGDGHGLRTELRVQF